MWQKPSRPRDQDVRADASYFYVLEGAKSVRAHAGGTTGESEGSERVWTGPLGTARTRRHTLAVRDGAGGDADRGRCGGSGEAAV